MSKHQGEKKDKQPEILTKAKENLFSFYILYLFFPHWSWKQKPNFQGKGHLGGLYRQSIYLLKALFHNIKPMVNVN